MMPMQKIVMVTGIILFATFLFPPFQAVHPAGGAESAGYGFIFSPPKGAWRDAKIDVAVLLTEWLGIVLISVMGGFFVMLRKDGVIKNVQLTDKDKDRISGLENQMLQMAGRYDEGEISAVELEKHRIEAERQIRDLFTQQKNNF